MQLQFVYGNPSKKVKKKIKKGVKAVAKRKKRKKSKGRKASAKRPKKSSVKRRKVSKKRRGRRRRKMVSHRHAATVRHLRKGSKAKARLRKGKAKLKFKYGKKKVSLSARLDKKKNTLNVRVNPKRRRKRKNPYSYSIAGYAKTTTPSGKTKYVLRTPRRNLGKADTLGENYSKKAAAQLLKEKRARTKRGTKKHKNIGSRYKAAAKRAKTSSAKRKRIGDRLKVYRNLAKRDGLSMRTKKNYRKNPMGGTMRNIESLLGSNMKEVGGLAAGGLLYGAVNGAVARFARPVHSQLVKIPVVGTALPTLLMGALANWLGERQGIEALQVVGKGLVGASVVGMGVNASQMVPQLRPAVSPIAGLGYEELYGLPEGLGSDGADFGSDEADFGGIDYTMEGIDYTMEGQMGSDDADFGGIDYTMEGLPEGMGEGQMG
jgi:hypothetical protein